MTDNNFTPELITELPFGLPGRIYRSPMPFRLDEGREDLIEQFKTSRIDTVINLVPEDEAYRKTNRDLRTVYSEYGIKMILVPSMEGWLVRVVS